MRIIWCITAAAAEKTCQQIDVSAVLSIYCSEWRGLERAAASKAYVKQANTISVRQKLWGMSFNLRRDLIKLADKHNYRPSHTHQPSRFRIDWRAWSRRPSHHHQAAPQSVFGDQLLWCPYNNHAVKTIQTKWSAKTLARRVSIPTGRQSLGLTNRRKSFDGCLQRQGGTGMLPFVQPPYSCWKQKGVPACHWRNAAFWFLFYFFRNSSWHTVVVVGRRVIINRVTCSSMQTSAWRWAEKRSVC